MLHKWTSHRFGVNLEVSKALVFVASSNREENADKTKTKKKNKGNQFTLHEIWSFRFSLFSISLVHSIRFDSIQNYISCYDLWFIDRLRVKFFLLIFHANKSCSISLAIFVFFHSLSNDSGIKLVFLFAEFSLGKQCIANICKFDKQFRMSLHFSSLKCVNVLRTIFLSSLYAVAAITTITTNYHKEQQP